MFVYLFSLLKVPKAVRVGRTKAKEQVKTGTESEAE